jgi:alpha-ribazole phosphatase
VKLYLARHAQPLVAKGVCYGASDVVCSADVLETAAQELLKVLPTGLHVISSPLSRCEQLAQILCRLQPDLTYKTDEKLAEMHFGSWEMQAWDAIPPEELKAWTDAFATYRCGGWGESTGQFVQRVAQRLHESLQSGEDQIWITHAGVIRAVQWLASQQFALFTGLLTPPLTPPLIGQERQPDPALHLSQLRAADWPTGEVAWCQVQQWDWPPAWPLPPWASE